MLTEITIRLNKSVYSYVCVIMSYTYPTLFTQTYKLQWNDIRIISHLKIFRVSFLGGWTLIKNITFSSSVIDDSAIRSHYSAISDLGTFEFVNQPPLNQLKQDMGFTQIRYYCRKASVGRVFHIMTANNDSGYDAVRWLSNDF